MRKVKKIIAGVMSALMLLANCPMDKLTAYAAESERPSATETDAAEIVTIYKGGVYAYGGETSSWYSTDEAPDSTNVNAYSVVSEYEMSENSISAEPVSVMDETLVKAIYYSYGAPGYQNMQTIMEETFLSCHAVTEEERAVESLKTCIDNLPEPSKNFQVCLLSDETTENEYDLIFWRI